MCPTKKLVLWVVIALVTQFFALSSEVFASEETYFIATAYYSPLPNQDSYTTGSYYWDIRLNGEWVTTASGKWVFPGLLAGPKNYPFGTKIYFEGYGIGAIEDRGGAIVKAGNRGYDYDRIDIWMWYGDEGLQRAKKWGKRKIKGKIVVPSSKVSLKIPESKLWVLTKLQVNPENSKTEDVKKLQKIFTKAELYDDEIDGEYESIKDELIEFQIKNIDEIDSAEHPHAGWYGKKTIAALRSKYPGSNEILVKENISLFHSFNHKKASEKYKIILEYGDLVVTPESTSESIESLQKLLSELGEYNGVSDGDYESIKEPLLELQKKIGLIKNDDDWGAGYFGNKTKSALWKYYEINDPAEQKANFGQKEKITLQESEKQRMKKALEFIRAQYEKEEKRGGKSVQFRFSQLEKQIQEYLPKVPEGELKLKLIYLQNLLRN